MAIRSDGLTMSESICRHFAEFSQAADYLLVSFGKGSDHED